MKKIALCALIALCAINAFSQELEFQKQRFEVKNVTASIAKLNGENVIKVERDLKALPFDTARLEGTVDEPTYVKLKGVDFENGTIEFKMYSEIQNPSPFKSAQGFIGVAFRIDENDQAYESIYLRPRVGRSDNQMARNHTVQYYAYPDFKFDKLRKEAPGMYETTAPVNIKEWITMRIEVSGEKAYMYINDAVALWVDIGTIGYFKDLKVIKK
jgi:hypothetical protein